MKFIQNHDGYADNNMETIKTSFLSVLYRDERTYHGFRGLHYTPLVSFTCGENFSELLTPEKSRKVHNYSSDGFEWGYKGSGPMQLALALLLEHGAQETAKKHIESFHGNFVSSFDEENWSVKEREIRKFSKGFSI